MTSLYRYSTDAGLLWAALDLADDAISAIVRSSRDGVLSARLSIDDARSLVSPTSGGMLSFGEGDLRRGARPLWRDLAAEADAAGVSVPDLISRSLLDNFSIRILVPSGAIASLRECDVLVYARVDASILADSVPVAVSGHLESRRLLGSLISRLESRDPPISRPPGLTF